MTVTIDLSPEAEARLHAQAEAQGRPIEEYLRSVIEELVSPAEETPGEPTQEQLEQMLDDLAAGSENLPDLPTKAFSRANIYNDHTGL